MTDREGERGGVRLAIQRRYGHMKESLRGVVQRRHRHKLNEADAKPPLTVFGTLPVKLSSVVFVASNRDVAISAARSWLSAAS